MQKRRLLSLIVTFIPCYAFWLLLTMSLKPEELLGGVVICGITAWFSSGFFVQNDQMTMKNLNPIRIVKFVWFLAVIFMWELLKANWAMAKTVLTGAQLKQAIVKVPVHGINNYYALAVLADCITLTPGTITIDVAKEGEDYFMYVQWLIMESEDPEEAGEIIKGRMERWIGGIWA